MSPSMSSREDAGNQPSKSEKSVAWPGGDAATLPLGAFSLDIRASFELDRMLGNGKLIGELETTWDEPFDG
ncbi:uncharacterized protein F5147DRAFT_837983 [Suillus discolor]|uniref:Uncharacterized protein n=1 Tax=Suillus discolor TaxID=1912936 RepID=A0A9P7F396_9AGAM|nr:uncharacterized protein F5147DRAFT_837983 [Suillus discolor]KAG2105773.1 hypothetical protein F5147DRAFT_837983 [Suillus discolor]